MKKFKEEKQAANMDKEKLFSKIFEDEKKRQEEQRIQEEIAYIRGKDVV